MPIDWGALDSGVRPQRRRLRKIDPKQAGRLAVDDELRHCRGLEWDPPGLSPRKSVQLCSGTLSLVRPFQAVARQSACIDLATVSEHRRHPLCQCHSAD